MQQLSTTSIIDGDAALAGIFLQQLPLSQPVYAACIATVDPQGERIATIGCGLEQTFHIGSVSKGLNGLIYTQMLHAGLITLEDRLDDYLPLKGTAAGRATLESCLTHTSGLPATGGGRLASARVTAAILTGRDPQPEGVDALMVQLRRAKVGKAGSFLYSNLAASALGHALAAIDGTDYAEMVHRRLSVPLGCASLRAQQPEERGFPQDLPGLSVWGTEQRPWVGKGYGPAGVIRGSAQDYATILSALLASGDEAGTEAAVGAGGDGSTRRTGSISSAGRAVHDDAFRVRFSDGAQSVAAGWFVDEEDGRGLIWHNGFTSGFSAHLVVNRQSGQGCFISLVTPWPDLDTGAVARELLLGVASNDSFGA